MSEQQNWWRLHPAGPAERQSRSEPRPEAGSRLEPAPEVNPADVDAVTDAIQSITSKTHRIMTVGGAGRNLSPIACIINDRGRALGRGGSGAVFASKNLLAIAVRGEESVATC